MGLEVLQVLEHGGVIAYALPAHTSGTTQPLDVGLFGPFKSHVDNAINSISATGLDSDKPYDCFDFLKLLTEAYNSAMTPSNVRSAFRRSGLWPVRPLELLGTPRPQSAENPSTIISVEEMEDMMVEKRKDRAKGLGIKPVVTKCGYIDTSKGMTLTSAEAMEIVERGERLRAEKFAKKQDTAARKASRKSMLIAQKRACRENWERDRFRYRVDVYGDPDVMPRPMKLRPVVAAQRTLALKNTATE